MAPRRRVGLVRWWLWRNESEYMAGPFKWMLVLSGIGLLYFLVAIVVAGGGHGSFVPLIIGFPWMTICTLWDSGITPFFWMLGLIQFPVYGLLFGIE